MIRLYNVFIHQHMQKKCQFERSRKHVLMKHYISSIHCLDSARHDNKKNVSLSGVENMFYEELCFIYTLSRLRSTGQQKKCQFERSRKHVLMKNYVSSIHCLDSARQDNKKNVSLSGVENMFL